MLRNGNDHRRGPPRRRHVIRGHTLEIAAFTFSQDQLRQLTLDDSWVASVLAEDPQVDPASLVHHPMRNALTNAVGALAGTEVHVIEERLVGASLIALTTDGVHGVLDERRIGMVLSEGWDPAAMATNLVRAALARGSQDNCTAVVAHYRELLDEPVQVTDNRNERLDKPVVLSSCFLQPAPVHERSEGINIVKSRLCLLAQV